MGVGGGGGGGGALLHGEFFFVQSERAGVFVRLKWVWSSEHVYTTILATLVWWA